MLILQDLVEQVRKLGIWFWRSRPETLVVVVSVCVLLLSLWYGFRTFDNYHRDLVSQVTVLAFEVPVILVFLTWVLNARERVRWRPREKDAEANLSGAFWALAGISKSRAEIFLRYLNVESDVQRDARMGQLPFVASPKHSERIQEDEAAVFLRRPDLIEMNREIRFLEHRLADFTRFLDEVLNSWIRGEVPQGTIPGELDAAVEVMARELTVCLRGAAELPIKPNARSRLAAAAKDVDLVRQSVRLAPDAPA